MYNSQNRHPIANGAIHTWMMQGLPGQNANLTLVLKTTLVVLPDGRRGFAIDEAGSTIPDEIMLLKAPVDVVEHDGQTVWATGGNGLDVWYDGEVYTLMKAEEVADDAATGVVYYHFYPPTEFGGGDIVYSADQNLELG